MTKEDLFRAAGEVREDQIEAAEVVKKQVRPRRRFGALAACLALVVAAAAISPLMRGQPQWNHIIYSFNPSAGTGGTGDAGTQGDAEASSGGLDGSYYWAENPPTHSDYSTGVEIGEMSGPGDNPGTLGLSACLAQLTPREIFAQDRAIFRGTVRELQYFQVQMESFTKGGISISVYCTRALVEVTDCIRGNLKEGETCSILWLGANGYLTTSLIGPLEDLEEGSDAIFLPIPTDRDTGWQEGDSYFCYADLGEFYLGEGIRYVFAGTEDGLEYDRSTYPELNSLDEAAAYIRKQIGEADASWRVVIGGEKEPESGGYVFVEGAEQTQPAAEPAVPQTEPSRGPSETADAEPSAPGPNGARELPGGAYIGE
ncbi:MAG: hypothetical protein HFG00_00835 [Oscillibacter sp.]|nr:hypothetical protein [Oscillibacter sp.]